MEIIAALVVLSVAAGVRPAEEITCHQPIICPCGNTGKNVTVCITEDNFENPCIEYSQCKACQDGFDGCLECPEGLEDSSCMGGCPEINSPKLGSIRCVYDDRQRTCIGKCLPGYTFEGHGSETEMTLTCTGDYYTPLREFPPCKSGGHCDLIAQGAGSFNCTTGMSGTRCDVICRDQFMGRYFCYPGRAWEPNLPHCVRPKDVQEIRQSCRCENGGRCDGNDNCICPSGRTGRYCEKNVQEISQICTCENGGRCDGNGNCICPTGRTGRYCEKIVPQKRTCRDPGFVVNGLRKNPDETDSSVRQSFEEGESVVYSCVSEEYALQGSSLLTCKNDGKWSSPLPQCIRISISAQRTIAYCRDPGTDPNGDRDPRSPPSHRGFPQGSHLDYFCNHGYELEGEKSIFCLTSRSWSSGRPTCKPQEAVTPAVTYCQDPGIDPNGGRNVMQSPGRRGYLEGSRLEYFCNQGYDIVGERSIFCLSSGRWSNERPTCRFQVPVESPRFCRDPGVDPNGSRKPRFPPNRQGFPHGTQVEYSCNEGYELKGEQNLFCLASGEWLSERPSCEELLPEIAYCPNPGVFENGRVVYFPKLGSRRGTDASLEDDEYPEGGRLQYTCDFGYILQGSESLTCQPSGEWSSKPPFCRSAIINRIIIYCPNPGPISNGKVEYVPTLNERRPKPEGNAEEYPEYPQGSSLVYTCNQGYVMRGESEIKCEDTRQWSAPPPFCLTSDPTHILYCFNPGPLLNGKIRFHSAMAGPRSGSTSLVSEDTPEFPEGTALIYECDDGYILEGTVTLKCQSSGIWSAVPPKCIPDCGRSMAGATRRILHGNKTFIGEWPWVVGIAVRANNRSRIICGGAVLNTRTVITAAHCLQSGNQYYLYFGKHYRSDRLDDDQVQTATSERLIIHPEFNNVTLDSDIALIRFKPKIKYSFRVQPICLPDGLTTNKNLNIGKKGYVTGWGENEKQLDSGELMMAYLPFQSNSDCLASFRANVANFYPTLTQNMFCAGFPQANQSTCRGDSGSPLVFYDPVTEQHTIEGIVSYTVEGQCGLPGIYSVYTKVFRFFDWIVRNM